MLHTGMAPVSCLYPSHPIAVASLEGGSRRSPRNLVALSEVPDAGAGADSMEMSSNSLVNGLVCWGKFEPEIPIFHGKNPWVSG